MIIEDDVIQRPRPEVQAIETVPPAMLKEPLEFLFNEHYRHRQLCKILEALAVLPRLELSLTAATLDFIRFDLALHVIDEEEDLFPLLRRRCEPEDDIEDVLGRLSGEHASDQEQAKAVRAVLETILREQRPAASDARAAEVLKRFATHQRGHLALENAIVLPLARRRLSPVDLAAMSQRLAARRGIVLCPERLDD